MISHYHISFGALACWAAVAIFSGSSVIMAHARVTSGSNIMTSILDNVWRNCLTCCGSPDTNTQDICQSPTSRSSCWKFTRYSFTHFFRVKLSCYKLVRCDEQVVPVWCATKLAFYSLSICWCMMRASFHRHSSNIHLTSVLLQRSHIILTHWIYCITGLSVVVQPKSGIIQ